VACGLATTQASLHQRLTNPHLPACTPAAPTSHRERSWACTPDAPSDPSLRSLSAPASHQKQHLPFPLPECRRNSTSAVVRGARSGSSEPAHFSCAKSSPLLNTHMKEHHACSGTKPIACAAQHTALRISFLARGL
jgi:hypothetical protein